jgi:hypothetical protein
VTNVDPGDLFVGLQIEKIVRRKIKEAFVETVELGGGMTKSDDVAGCSLAFRFASWSAASMTCRSSFQSFQDSKLAGSPAGPLMMLWLQRKLDSYHVVTSTFCLC